MKISDENSTHDEAKSVPAKKSLTKTKPAVEINNAPKTQQRSRGQQKPKSAKQSIGKFEMA